jgi:large subunit ribosomal protein L9
LALRQVVLTKEVPNLGAPGLLTSVRVGFFRNYLLPQGYAKLADEGILAAIKVKREAEEAAARKARCQP